jgi:hypothetical protein
MGTEFQSRRIEVPDGPGTKNFEGPGTFSRTVRSADIAIKSFGFDFTGQNRPAALNIVQVATSIVNLEGPFLQWAVECKYLDLDTSSYAGFIEILLIADVP